MSVVLTTYGTSLRELVFDRLPPAPPDQAPVERIATWIPVTPEAVTDGPYIRAVIEELMRLDALARLGFLGHVRCARCRRRIRCVWAVVHGMHYGRDCYRLTFPDRPDPWTVAS